MDVTVIGSCNVDFICYAPRLPATGETLIGAEFEMGNGGKGANQSAASAKLGASTALIARLGDDVFGQMYLDKLKKVGVDTKNVLFTKGVSSGIAQITVSITGENTIVIIPGANNKLSFDDVLKAESDLINSKVVVFQLEVPLATVRSALEFIKGKGPITVLNAAPALPTLTADTVNLCDILCINEVEAQAISGISVVGIESAKEAIRHLLTKLTCRIIITLGENGVVFTDEGIVSHRPARVVEPVDTTGAGDAFVGALSFFLSRFPEMPFAEKVSRSATVATYSVLKRGTQISFPTSEELPQTLFE